MLFSQPSKKLSVIACGSTGEGCGVRFPLSEVLLILLTNFVML